MSHRTSFFEGALRDIQKKTAAEETTRQVKKTFTHVNYFFCLRRPVVPMLVFKEDIFTKETQNPL